jgi:hypothetical protein
MQVVSIAHEIFLIPPAPGGVGVEAAGPMLSGLTSPDFEDRSLGSDEGEQVFVEPVLVGGRQTV